MIVQVVWTVAEQHRAADRGAGLSSESSRHLLSHRNCLSQRNPCLHELRHNRLDYRLAGCSSSPLGSSKGPKAGSMGAHDRRTTVIVHEIGTVLGAVAKPAQCQAILTGVTSITVTTARDHHALVGIGNAGGRGEASQWPVQCRGKRSRPDVVIIVTAIRRDISSREESSAVIDNRLIPFQLIERIHAQAVGQALRVVEHVDRNQAIRSEERRGGKEWVRSCKNRWS